MSDHSFHNKSCSSSSCRMVVNHASLDRKEPNVTELNLEELRIEFEFERKKRQQWRTLFKESARDLGEEEEVMIREGEDEEDERWLNKYKIQRTKNGDLEAEYQDLQTKIDITRLKLKDAERSMAVKNPLDYSDSEVRKLLAQTNKDRDNLERSLKDYEWRLDSESQKYSKAEDQRKTFMVQLYGATEANRILSTERILDKKRKFKNSSSSTKNSSNNLKGRMLDPKKGPVKKGALVRNLPKIETSPTKESDSDQ